MVEGFTPAFGSLNGDAQIFLDPVLTMAAYNEGVRFCVQSAAKTINVCLEVYSRKDDEAKVQAFAAAVREKFEGKVVAGLTLEWAVIYKGGLLRVAVPANKTADEIAAVMAEFRTLVMPDYITFMEGVSPVEAKPAKVKKVKEAAPQMLYADEVPVTDEAPAEEELVAAAVFGEDEVPVVEEEPDLA